MPVMCGSTIHKTATAVTAASAAVPPARSMSIAASVDNGWEVAAMPSQAITGERPGSWKSRLMTGSDEVSTYSRRNALDTLKRKVSLSRAQSNREAAEHVDEAHEEEQEKCRGGGLLDENKFDQHAEEKNQRQRVVDDGTSADARRFHHLTAEQQDRERDEHVTRRHRPIYARHHVDRGDHAAPRHARHEKCDDVVDREWNQQQRKAEHEHGAAYLGPVALSLSLRLQNLAAFVHAGLQVDMMRTTQLA